MFVVRHPQRDKLAVRLNDMGIGTLIHYPIPPHKQAAYAELNFPLESFPKAAKMAEEVLSLPIGPHLEIRLATQVLEAIKELQSK